MKMLIFLFAFILLTSCSKEHPRIEENQSIVGEWKLIANYFDIGDGSGKFNPVKSEKIIQFSASNDVWVKNGNLCAFISEDLNPRISTYDLTEKEYNSLKYNYVNIIGCNIEYQYKIEGDLLTLYYPCIEGCGERFVRVK